MGSFEETVARGLWWALLSVFGAGVATSLTPCVYPMIPITVSVFGAKQSRSRTAAFLLATCYVEGIALTYTALGLLAGLGGWAAGSVLASPWFIVPLSVLFAVLALSMFGIWEAHLPHWLSSRIALVGGHGYRGAFLMGLVGGIIIAPCTGPVLAGLLTYVASTRNVGLGAALLFTYAQGIGVLFWVIATFSVSMPKAGRWMTAVSSLFGVALLVAAFYYLQNVVTPLARFTGTTLTFALICGGLVLAGLVVGALHLDFRGRGTLVALRKATGILLVCTGAFGLVNYSATPSAKLPWKHDELEALAQAHRTGKPVLIDFSASWCRPCKVMEADVLSHPAVRRALQRFVLLKIDVTYDTARDQQLKRKYQARELPQLVLLGPDGREQARAGKVNSTGEMLALLRRVR